MSFKISHIPSREIGASKTENTKKVLPANAGKPSSDFKESKWL